MNWHSSGTGLDNYGSNHCFLNSAVQALFHLSLDIDLEDERFESPIGKEVVKLLKQMRSRTGISSVDRLRESLSYEFSSTGIFNARAFGDSYQAFCAILQELYKDNPNSKIVKHFQHLIIESAHCNCTQEPPNLWNEDCFGISVFITTGNEQFLSDFRSKQVEMCLSGGRCSNSTLSLKFKQLPEVLVFHCSYSNEDTSSEHFYSRNLHRRRKRISIPKTFDLEDLVEDLGENFGYSAPKLTFYELKGVVFMIPGHYFSGFKVQDRWTIFNDSHITSCSSIEDFLTKVSYAEPYLLFYQRSTSLNSSTAGCSVNTLPSKQLSSTKETKKIALKPKECAIDSGIYSITARSIECQALKEYSITADCSPNLLPSKQRSATEETKRIVQKQKETFIDSESHNITPSSIGCQELNDEVYTTQLFYNKDKTQITTAYLRTVDIISKQHRLVELIVKMLDILAFNSTNSKMLVSSKRLNLKECYGNAGKTHNAIIMGLKPKYQKLKEFELKLIEHRRCLCQKVRLEKFSFLCSLNPCVDTSLNGLIKNTFNFYCPDCVKQKPNWNLRFQEAPKMLAICLPDMIEFEIENELNLSPFIFVESRSKFNIYCLRGVLWNKTVVELAYIESGKWKLFNKETCIPNLNSLLNTFGMPTILYYSPKAQAKTNTMKLNKCKAKFH